MKSSTFAWSLLFLVAVASCSSSEEPSNLDTSIPDNLAIEVPKEPEYELIWGDEFDYEGSLDDEKWHFQVEPITETGWANEELQHYTNRLENAYVSDGTLKIVAKRETYEYAGLTKEYTSARLNSKFDFQYGKVEVRAKLPASAGTWPAIWTLGSNINEKGNYFGDTRGSVGWPQAGEIDIMEQTGYNKNQTQGWFHWANGNYGKELTVPESTTTFHNYVLIWNEDYLDIFVDNRLVVRMDNIDTVPFDNPHYILLNVAMGGNLGGDVPNNYVQDQMEIDYVRVYQLED